MSPTWSTLLTSALGGAGVGVVAGFIAAIIALQARRWRNAVLMRRDQPPIKDAIRPPFHLPGAVFGLLLSPVLSLWLPMVPAVVIGGCGLPAVIVVLTIAGAIQQSRRTLTWDDPPG